MIRRAIAAVVAMGLPLAMPAAAQGPGGLSLEQVDFSPECEPSAMFEQMLMVDQGVHVDVAEQLLEERKITDLVAGDASHVVRFDNALGWHGLRLVELRFEHGFERGPANYTMVFADSPERVREVWNTRGWNLPPVGEKRVIDDEVIVTAVGIVADGEFAAVTCFVD